MNEDELREHAEVVALFAGDGPKSGQTGLCHECNCVYEAPTVRPVADDPTRADFFCPICGDHFARWDA